MYHNYFTSTSVIVTGPADFVVKLYCYILLAIGPTKLNIRYLVCIQTCYRCSYRNHNSSLQTSTFTFRMSTFDRTILTSINITV